MPREIKIFTEGVRLAAWCRLKWHSTPRVKQGQGWAVRPWGELESGLQRQPEDPSKVTAQLLTGVGVGIGLIPPAWLTQIGQANERKSFGTTGKSVRARLRLSERLTWWVPNFKKQSRLCLTWLHSHCALRYFRPLVPWLGRTPFQVKPITLRWSIPGPRGGNWQAQQM